MNILWRKYRDSRIFRKNPKKHEKTRKKPFLATGACILINVFFGGSVCEKQPFIFAPQDLCNSRLIWPLFTPLYLGSSWKNRPERPSKRVWHRLLVGSKRNTKGAIFKALLGHEKTYVSPPKTVFLRTGSKKGGFSGFWSKMAIFGVFSGFSGKSGKIGKIQTILHKFYKKYV